MSSRRLARLLALATLLVALAAPTASADGPGATGGSADQARATAVDFMASVSSADYDHFCQLLTAPLAAIYADGGPSCGQSLREANDPVLQADARAKGFLDVAYRAARAESVFHDTPLGHFTSKAFPLPALLKAIERDEPELRLRLGAGPQAARATATATVVIDVKRSSPTRLVLYNESDSGAIFGLRMDDIGNGGYFNAGQGLAQPLPPATRPPLLYDLESLSLASDGTVAYATVVVHHHPDDAGQRDALRLVYEDGPLGPSFYVDDVLGSLFGF